MFWLGCRGFGPNTYKVANCSKSSIHFRAKTIIRKGIRLKGLVDHQADSDSQTCNANDVTKNSRWLIGIQTCVGLQTLFGLSVHGLSFGGNSVLWGQQHSSAQSSAQPQSHSSPSSTTPLPHNAVWGSEMAVEKVTRLLTNSAYISLQHCYLLLTRHGWESYDTIRINAKPIHCLSILWMDRLLNGISWGNMFSLAKPRDCQQRCLG